MDREPSRRPPGREPPAHLPPSPPVPAPAAAMPDETETLSPTRYGDWEKNGIAIDF